MLAPHPCFYEGLIDEDEAVSARNAQNARLRLGHSGVSRSTATKDPFLAGTRTGREHGGRLNDRWFRSNARSVTSVSAATVASGISRMIATSIFVIESCKGERLPPPAGRGSTDDVSR